MRAFTDKVVGSSAARAIDTDAVRAALVLLTDPKHGVELRGVPSGRSYVHPSTDVDGLCASAARLTDDKGVYWTLNPIPPSLQHPAKVDDVFCRRWLLVDIDPVRPVETNATNEEKESARMVAEQTREWLSERGWPAPVMVDSGNGWHLLYRIDLPNNEHARQLLKLGLIALAKRFDTDAAKIDRSVHNASRISKLPGTWACKGPHSAERPHRMARIIFAPDPPAVVPAEMIARLTEEEPAKLETNGKHSHFTDSTSNDADRAYARKALDNECARVRLARPGPDEGRNNALNRAAFSMAQLVAGGLILENEVVGRLYEAAIDCGLEEQEIRRTIQSGLKAGKAKPRERPEKKEKEAAAPKGDAPGPVTIGATEITPQPVRWLWYGRIPLGKLTTWAGRTGLGKSFVTCDLAARLSRGAEIPFGGGETFERGGTLIVNTEDDYSDTLVPRLMKANADLSMVRFMRTERMYCWQLAHFDVLERAIKETPNCRLVVIDPSTAHLGGKSGDSNTELREVLTPLMLRAQTWGCAVVLVTHFNKSGGVGKIEAVARVIGSVAWVAAVRAASAFVPNVTREDKTRALFVPLKSNLSQRPKALSYRISGEQTDTGVGVIEWIEEVDLTADEAMDEERRNSQSKSTDAEAWLRAFFADKDEAPSDHIFQLAAREGISTRTCYRVKERLPIKAEQKPAPRGSHYWVWKWTGERQPVNSDCQEF